MYKQFPRILVEKQTLKRVNMKGTMLTFTYLDSSLFYEENKARLFYLSENGNADIGFIQKEY